MLEKKIDREKRERKANKKRRQSFEISDFVFLVRIQSERKKDR